MSEKTVLQVKWEELENISEEMEENTESINENLKKLQEALVNLKIGVSSWSSSTFEMREGPDLNNYKVGFCKHSYDWKFVVRKIDEDGNFVGRMFPLVESSRILRIRSCKLLHEVLENIGSKAQTFVKDTKEANESIKDEQLTEKIQELKQKIIEG